MRRYLLPVIFMIFIFVIVPGVMGSATIFTNWLWFKEIGYTSVFVKSISTQIALAFAVGVAMFVWLVFNAFLAHRLCRVGLLPVGPDAIELPGGDIPDPLFRRFILLAALGVSAITGLSAATQWVHAQTFLHASPFGKPFDPVFHKDISFYIFQLPFLNYVRGLLGAFAGVAALAVVAVAALRRGFVVSKDGLAVRPSFTGHIMALIAAYLCVRAWGCHLARFNMLSEAGGLVAGMGYTDLHVRLPILNALTFLCLIAAAAFLASAFMKKYMAAAGAVALLLIVSIAGSVWGGVIQKFKVAPNEKRLEMPFLRHQIDFTRMAYGLTPGKNVTIKNFEARGTLTPSEIDANTATINNIRLWDPRPLFATYQQYQGIRTYYHFGDVDMDRYRINGEYTQVAIAAREIDYNHLPEDNWINRHFSFTHGFGLCVSPVTDVVEEGQPRMLVHDIPPRFESDLRVTQPRIYFGELTNEYVFVNASGIRAIDYPEGGKNRYTTYRGKGGIAVSSFVRRLAFALRFGSKDVLFSSGIGPKTRIMINRNVYGDKGVGSRAHIAMPLLSFDTDPYVVIDSRGRLKWIQDAYTTTDAYPYSAHSQGFNYIRNSVKIVTDAYDGTMDYYVADPNDPIIRTYMNIFPGVFKHIDKMPADLKAHLRYPEDLFRTQAEIFSLYQMDDPELFYEQEDRWVLPEEWFQDQKQPMEPYYNIMRLPGEKREEYVLMLPFTPKGRENMTAWMCARNDYDKGVYGRLLVYKFPAQEKTIKGPMQMETLITQEEEIASQMALWKRENNVTRGNLLVIPIENSLLYVEPVFLKAKTSEIPKITMIVAADGTGRIAWDTTLAGAIRKLLNSDTVLAELYEKQVNMLSGEEKPGGKTKIDKEDKGGGKLTARETPAQKLARAIQSARENYRNARMSLQKQNPDFISFQKYWDNMEANFQEIDEISKQNGTELFKGLIDDAPLSATSTIAAPRSSGGSYESPPPYNNPALDRYRDQMDQRDKAR